MTTIPRPPAAIRAAEPTRNNARPDTLCLVTFDASGPAFVLAGSAVNPDPIVAAGPDTALVWAGTQDFVHDLATVNRP